MTPSEITVVDDAARLRANIEAAKSNGHAWPTCRSCGQSCTGVWAGKHKCTRCVPRDSVLVP